MTPAADEFEYGKCPICGRRLIKRVSHNNEEFIGCESFPRCQFSISLDKKEKSLISSLQNYYEQLLDYLIDFIFVSKNQQIWNTSNKSEKQKDANYKDMRLLIKKLYLSINSEKSHFERKANDIREHCLGLLKNKS